MDRYATLRQRLVGAWCPSLMPGGQFLVDRSALTNNATLAGSPLWSAGAIDLSAASTYGEIAHRSQYLITGGFSVCGWFTSTTATLTFNDTIISKEQATTPNFPWVLRGANTGSGVAFRVMNSGGTEFNATATSTAFGLVTNTWFSAIGVFDGANARLYINGVLLATSSSFSGTIATNTVPLRIGDSYGAPGRQWPGLLDDVRLYGRVLLPSEIKLLASRRGIGLVPTRHRRGYAAASTATTMSLNVAGTWKDAVPWINVGGTWKEATPYTKVGSLWK